MSEAEARPGEAISPFGSLGAVIGGWITVLLLGFLTMPMLFALFPGEFAQDEDGTTTTTGFAITLAAYGINGLLGGFVAGRLAGVAPIVHAAILGGFVGFAGLMSSDAAQGMPFWFALGRALVPALAIVLGGLVAREVARRRDALTARTPPDSSAAR